MNTTQTITIPKDNLLFSFGKNLQKWWISRIQNNELQFSIGKSLLEAIVGMIASLLTNTTDFALQVNGMKQLLANRFRQLIKVNFKAVKQVKQYASLLHITPLYLNEVMSELTGFPASYWIHQEILLEAKRLLSYSEKDIKEISWELGYEDHAYFSRFFKKNIGLTASAFRAQKP